MALNTKGKVGLVAIGDRLNGRRRRRGCIRYILVRGLGSCWLWRLGRSPVPERPVLDLGFSWIPFNIQEVHVGWDRVNLSTNW